MSEESKEFPGHTEHSLKSYRTLYQIDHDEFPMWVVARDWSTAIHAWRNEMTLLGEKWEHGEPTELPQPKAVTRVCDSDDIVIAEVGIQDGCVDSAITWHR